MRIFSHVDELATAVGERLGHSQWHTVDHNRVIQFAAATGDHQWIHVNPERAAQGPFGRTIAHGYLTLAMIPMLVGEIYRVENVSMGINYGSNKVRFVSPVPVDSTVRAGAELVSVTPGPAGVQVVVHVTVEMAGSDRPACVAETVSVLVPARTDSTALTGRKQ